MSRSPTRATVAGRAYLALQRKAKAEGRATDELLQLFALEAFLDRMSTCSNARDLVLKGGVLLAAYDMRRPTRDIDLSASKRRNEESATLALVQEILNEPRDDGWIYSRPRADVIRSDDEYSGIRVTVPCTLASAKVSFHVDVNFGDPIWPEPRDVAVPRLFGGAISVRGYPLCMVLAEKLVTAVQRGTANTRWRDFADVYLLSGHHEIGADELTASITRVAAFRRAEMATLAQALDGFADLAQSRWASWVRRQRLDARLPTSFAEVLSAVQELADPIISGAPSGLAWRPASRSWM